MAPAARPSRPNTVPRGRHVRTNPRSALRSPASCRRGDAPPRRRRGRWGRRKDREQHARPIDLLLTDVVMPEMSGRELANRLAGLHPDMRVMFMSGYTDDRAVQRGLLGPHDAFLAKPFTPDRLRTKVREVLDSRPDR